MSKLSRSAIPTPAMVVACIALLVSLSGTAIALPGKNKLDANDFPVGVVRSAAIRNGGVASADLKDGIVVPSKVAPGAIATGALQFGSVTNPKLGANSVTAPKIADNSVGTSEIVADGVGSSEIASNAVGSGEIASSAVGTSEIATNGVASAEIASNAVGADEIASNAVGGGEIAGGAVTGGKLGGITVRTDASPTSVPPGSADLSSVSCASGEVAFGGGGTWDNEAADVVLVSARYLTTNGRPTGYEVRGRNNSGAAREITAQVSCMAP